MGDTVSVDVVASDLVSGGAPSLGAYDLNLTFDSAVLSFSSIAFGSGLSVTGVPSIIQDFALGTGSVNPFEVSLEDTADLNALQAGAFTLFTITFNAAHAGTNSLSLGVNSLSSAEGDGAHRQYAEWRLDLSGRRACCAAAGGGVVAAVRYRGRRLAGAAAPWDGGVARSPQSPGGSEGAQSPRG